MQRSIGSVKYVGETKMKKEKKDKNIILSVRCKDVKHAVVFGSEKRPCMRCGELVWVSPALKNEKMDAMCIDCMTEKERKEGKVIVKREVIEQFLKLKYHGHAG